MFTIFTLGCGGGSSSSDGSGDTSKMVVTPSLGLILNYDLEMTHVDGSPISISTEVNADGSVTIPEVLRPYMYGQERIVAK